VAGPGIWNLRDLGFGSKTPVSMSMIPAAQEPEVERSGVHVSLGKVSKILSYKQTKKKHFKIAGV
jgi:hypothetical protein